MSSEELKSTAADLYDLADLLRKSMELPSEDDFEQKSNYRLKTMVEGGYFELNGSEEFSKPTEKLLKIYALSQAARSENQKFYNESSENAFGNLVYFVQNGFRFSDSFFDDPSIAKAYAENLQRLENGSKK